MVLLNIYFYFTLFFLNYICYLLGLNMANKFPCEIIMDKVYTKMSTFLSLSGTYQNISYFLVIDYINKKVYHWTISIVILI